jgi:zinc protease
MTGRDPGFWAGYRARIEAVTSADVERVAKSYLDPQKLAILVVGDQKEIAAGEEGDLNLAALGGGKVVDLPLRDPMTMKRP